MTDKAIPLLRPDLPDYGDFETDLVAEHGKAWRTAATYADHARYYVDWLTANEPDVAILDATPEHLRKYLRHLARTERSTSYRRLAVFGARWLYTWLGRDEDTHVNPAKRVKAPVQDKPTTAYYTPLQFRAMLLAARTAATGYQSRGLLTQARRAWFDLALLAVLRYTGLRLHELAGLDIADVNLDEPRLRVRRGKGGKPRYVPIARPLAAILAHYLAEVRPHCPSSPFLFANPSGLQGKGMYGRTAERAIHDVVVKYATAADIPGRHHPHRLRHGLATDLDMRGVASDATTGGCATVVWR